MLFHIFQTARLLLRSAAPQLIEKCLLTHCKGNVTVRLFNVPQQACHLQSNVFQLWVQIWHLRSSSRPSAHRLSVSLGWWGFTLLQPLSTRHRLRQLDICMLKTIKGVEEKKKERKKLKRLGMWVLLSHTTPGGSFQSTWIYTIRLNVSCDIRWWSNHFNVFISWRYTQLLQPSVSRNVLVRVREQWETVLCSLCVKF